MIMPFFTLMVGVSGMVRAHRLPPPLSAAWALRAASAIRPRGTQGGQNAVNLQLSRWGRERYYGVLSHLLYLTVLASSSTCTPTDYNQCPTRSHRTDSIDGQSDNTINDIDTSSGRGKGAQ